MKTWPKVVLGESRQEASEPVRELIRKDQDRLQLRGLLLTGAASTPSAPTDAGYFEGLRDRVRKAAKSATKV